jgi:hypothetical protein
MKLKGKNLKRIYEIRKGITCAANRPMIDIRGKDTEHIKEAIEV